MLLRRSRKTTDWSDDTSRILSRVIDESSTLEGRSLANFRHYDYDLSCNEFTLGGIAVALVSTNTQYGDLIIL